MSPLFRQPPILSLHRTILLLASSKHFNNAHQVGCQMLCFSSLSSRSRTGGKECRRSMSPAAARAPSEEEDDEDEDEDGEDEPKKSKGQKKRESLRSVTWAKSLVDLKPAQIWNVLRLTSVSQQEEVFEAAMIAKKMGPSILRAKRRQLRYVGKLLRELDPDLIDGALRASINQDIILPIEPSPQVDNDIIKCTTDQWMRGLLDKDETVCEEIYSLETPFDRKELRRLLHLCRLGMKEVEAEGDSTLKHNKAEVALKIFLSDIAKLTFQDKDQDK